MSGTVTTLIPSHAVTCWIDDTHVYVLLPTKDKSGFITKYALTDAGLNRALQLMRTVHKRQGGAKVYTLGDQSVVKRVEPFSESQREAARAVLKRLKIT